MKSVRKHIGSRRAAQGFTLVELIVVLVILAVLAAILVPTLLGYIDKARDEKNMAAAESIREASQAQFDQEYAYGNKHQGDPIGKISYTNADGTSVVTVNANDASATVQAIKKLAGFANDETIGEFGFNSDSQGALTQGFVAIDSTLYCYNNGAWTIAGEYDGNLYSSVAAALSNGVRNSLIQFTGGPYNSFFQNDLNESNRAQYNEISEKLRQALGIEGDFVWTWSGAGSNSFRYATQSDLDNKDEKGYVQFKKVYYDNDGNVTKITISKAKWEKNGSVFGFWEPSSVTETVVYER